MRTDKPFKTSNAFFLFGTILIIVAILLTFWFFLQGKTTVSGNFPENEKNEILICSTDGKEYPFFRYQRASNTTTEVNIIFKDGSLNALALKQFSYYDTPSMAIDSWNQNHAAMGTSFGKNGMSGDALSASYFKENNLMRMTLYASLNEINTTSATYFLIKDFSLSTTSDEFAKYYEEMGFNCKLNKENYEQN